MRTSLSTLALAAAIVTASCNSAHRDATEGPATLPLADNAGAAASAPLSVDNLTFTQLSSENPDGFFQGATILDVVGDTVVLLENTPRVARLLLYSLSDGSYLGEINHQGQGPGEYAHILGAFVDGANGTVLLPDFHSPAVNVYSLGSDSLVEVKNREFVPSVIPPAGAVESCINVVRPTPEGLDIMQYDRTFALTDSVTIPGFQGGNFSTVWTTGGGYGIIMVGDTICTLTPGTLTPIAIASRGEKAITPEAEGELMMKLFGGGDEIELLKPYILIRDIQLADGKILLTNMHDAQKHSDIYDLADGHLIYRNSYTTLSTPSEIVVEGESGSPLPVERIFAKNGKWYGIVSEETAAEISGTGAADTNYGIVSFTL